MARAARESVAFRLAPRFPFRLACVPVRLLFPAFVLIFAWHPLRGDVGDVESSRDYPGFPRYPGFIITDYDEDSPAAFNFPVARPQPTDASHVEVVRATGHRYVLRYEPGPNVAPPSLFQVQDYYEKLAVSTHFALEKSGAVGDVNETFHHSEPGHDIWVYLEPGMSSIGLTVMETRGVSPTVAATAAPEEDPLYSTLIKKGRVVLPITFLPSRPDLDTDAQPLIDRVVRLLQKHPDLQVSLEGHTDNSGDPIDNQRLSEARARTTLALIVAGGVDKRRLTASGLGGDKPVASNDTAEGRAQNRRIELVLRQP